MLFPPSRQRPPRRSRRPGARLVLWRLRWPVTAVLIGCACAVVVDALRPAGPATTAVVVSARDLVAGQRLTSADVRVATVAAALAPDERIVDGADAIGSTVAVDVPAGLPLVAELLTRTLAHGPPGTVVAPVRFADTAVAGLLSPGMRLDVLAATEDGTPGRYLAHDALVLPAPGGGSGSSSTPAGSAFLGPVGVPDEAPPVLLAVTPDEAAALAGAAATAALSAVVVG